MTFTQTLIALIAVVFTIAPAHAQQPAPQRVELHAGDVLIAPVVEQDAQRVVLGHATLGKISIARDKIKQITDPAAVAATPQSRGDEKPLATATPAATAPAPPPAAPAKPDGFVAQFLKYWKTQVTFGFNMRDSTTESSDYNAGFTMKHEDARDRWKIGGQFFYAEFEDNITRQDTHLSIQKDWLLPPSQWFIFAQSEYDHDNFKSWEHRVMAHGGLGYDFKKIVGLDAKLRGGFGVTREIGGVDPDTRPEGLASSEMSWQLNPIHTLAGTIQYYPGLDSGENFRVRTTGDWTMKLTKELGLKVGVWDEYDSTEPAGFEKNDLRVFGSMVYDF